MDQRGKNLLKALVFAGLSFAIAIALYNISEDGSILNRIAILFGGQFPEGIIQLFIFITFYWCIFEIISSLNTVKEERKGYALLSKLSKLPTLNNEHWVMSPDDVRDLKLEIINLHKEQGKSYLITNLLKKACTKFRSDKSISDVLSVVSEQTRINFSKAESGQSLIRFLSWSLPSIGFIGTILGIAGALGLADQASTEEGLKAITNALYLAFDTTLLALGFSIIVMWLFHRLQEKEEILHTDMEEFVIENLINRIVLR